MSAKILPTSSSSSSKLRDAVLSGRRRLDCQNDPALIVGLALAFTQQGDGDAAAIPSVLFDRLRRHAYFGDPTCALVLDWLTQKASARRDRAAASSDRHAVAQHAGPPEIVSASSASTMEEK